ncbi:MAG: DUF4838 domain-containing protein [Treponema sp.]|jgi:hypothetical protein|nr:DUF4838 domain-containing protein [Treponema sp.]
MKSSFFLKIQYLGSSETVAFAAGELKRYLSRMDGALEIVLIKQSTYDPSPECSLWVGLDDSFKNKVPKVLNSELDDGIYIEVKNGYGIITGVNERSVLLAAYRYLRELGCAWVFPGAGGERIGKTILSEASVSLSKTASYRHRGICIEGAVSCDHVLNMIDWIPKVGMNCYFNQFRIPFTFFDRWYSHQNNPEMEAVPVSPDEVAGMVRNHIGEIKKRGMLYHAVGHSWTCEPFGIEGNSWDVKDYCVPPESIKYLAQVKGRRDLFGGIPLNTNICYGNIEAREKITDAIVDYCNENPAVDYVHFWLADTPNNQCECDLCKNTEPSDFYVMMMNSLDEKLSASGLKTRIVFLLYQELLWEPKTETVKNPDRFVLMFAPISRTYSVAYVDEGIPVDAGGRSSPPEILEPYVRNQIRMPRDVKTNIARLRKWQEKVSGCDSFIFDYHYMWDHFRDPGYMDIAWVMFKDMQNLDKLGINGMVSCQTQRAFFPSGIGDAIMAEALWNKDVVFEKFAAQYFCAVYGGDGKLVMDYLKELSARFDPPYIRHEKAPVDPKKREEYRALGSYLDSFIPVIADNLREEKNPDVSIRYSWGLLRTHSDLCRIIARALIARAAGDRPRLETLFNDLAAFARLKEEELVEVFDVYLFIDTMKRALLGSRLSYV